MGVLSKKIDRKDLKPGDHIYSWRQAYLYAHHGIYVGEGIVIHFTRGAGIETTFDRLFTSSLPVHDTDVPCPICDDDGGQPRTDSDNVMVSCLNCFLSGGELYLFEYDVSCVHFLSQVRGGTCSVASSDPTVDVVRRAFYLLDNGFGDYNVFKNNCEDFAIYCKTGLIVTKNSSVGQSGQAASYLAAAKSIASLPIRFVRSSFWGMALVGGGNYFVGRLASDIGIRHKVIKDAIKVDVERIPDMMTRKN